MILVVNHLQRKTLFLIIVSFTSEERNLIGVKPVINHSKLNPILKGVCLYILEINRIAVKPMAYHFYRQAHYQDICFSMLDINLNVVICVVNH